jgi:hypothetical protein
LNTLTAGKHGTHVTNTVAKKIHAAVITSNVSYAAYPPQDIVFLVLCLVTVITGIGVQLFATLLVRRGTPIEHIGMFLGGDRDRQRLSEIFVLEREALVYFGNSLTSVGNLLVFSSVIASLAIDFPGQWLIGAIAFIVANVPAAFVACNMLSHLLHVRNIQQALYDGISAAEGQRSRDRVLAVRPDFETWRRTGNALSDARVIVLTLLQAAKRYDRPLEQRYLNHLQPLET